METNRKVYIETSCFVEMAKHVIGSGSPDRTDDIWHVKTMLQVAKDKKVEVFSAMLTVAECQHAIHAASALEMGCDELFSFDTVFHKKKKELDAIALRVCLPRNTACLPNEYRQIALEENRK